MVDKPPRHPDILSRQDACLVVVDVQEKLFPVIRDSEALRARCATLIGVARLLGVDILVSEQYVRGLGPTIGPLSDALGDAPRFEKSTFSCLGEPSFCSKLLELAPRQVILCGIETHICVQQTALDLIERGFDVHCCADACGTRLPQTHGLGIERMRQAGATITSVESAIFELVERCDIDDFKRVLPLVRDGE